MLLDTPETTVARTPPLSCCRSDGTQVSPFLDMAGRVDLPELQAESAAGLAELAQDDKSATSLCTAQAFKQFKKLLQSSQMEIVYPTARVLLHLAHCPEAAKCFAEEELLLLIVDKVRAVCTSPLVRQGLAQAFNVATAHCVGALSQQASELIMDALADAMKEIPR